MRFERSIDAFFFQIQERYKGFHLIYFFEKILSWRRRMFCEKTVFRLVKIAGAFLVATVCVLGGMYLHRYQMRQARVCGRKQLCSFKDFSSIGQIPPLQQYEVYSLQQPFFFLAKGMQSRVYESADGKYVLKLFKKPLNKKRKRALQESMRGAALAKIYLNKEAAFVAVSVGNQRCAIPTVHLLDEKGKCKQLDLENTPFIIQKKAQPLKRTLMTLVSEKRYLQAAEHLRSIFALLRVLREKGIVDRDGSLIRNENIGFIEGRAILLDTGKLCHMNDEKRQTLHDLNRLKPLKSWLESVCPSLVSVFEEEAKSYAIS